MTTWFAPGRLEIFGTHTDYAGGNSLVAAVDRGVSVTARRRGDRFVAASEHGERVEIDLRRGGQLPPGHWGRYVQAVLERLIADFGELPPAEISVRSNLPLASGMSSSSALLIGVALALVDEYGVRELPQWREAIETDLDLPAYLACVENGSPFKHLTGGTGVGTHGGSHDHTAILCGRDAQALHLNFNPMQLVDTVEIPQGWQFVVATSGVLAEKTGAALGDYNRCSAQVKEIVATAQARGIQRINLGGVIEELGAAATRDLVADSEPLVRRLQHFLLESNELVPEAIRALRDADQVAFGEAADWSQKCAEQLLGNQIPETIGLVEAATGLGAWGSASFGAGFGGSVWAVVPEADAAEFSERWIDEYRRRFPVAGALAAAIPVRPSAGARRVE